MAKIFHRKLGEPWPSQPQSTKSFGWCLQRLQFAEADLLPDLVNKDELPCPDTGGGAVYVELDDGEARQYLNWDAGVYLVKDLSQSQLNRILATP